LVIKINDNRILLSETEAKLWLVVLLTTSVLFVIGLFLPMMTLSKLVIFENTISVASGIYELFISGHYFLFLLVFGFSILLPLLKLEVLYQILANNQIKNKKQEKLLHLMHDYGRWGMLDVFVVAILIVTVKLDAIANISIHSGLYVFGLAVLMIMTITHRLIKLYEKNTMNP
jgi:paraquat-inducible protein A